jgi:hypothetical protein
MFDGAPGLTPERLSAQVDAIDRLIAAASGRTRAGTWLAVCVLRHAPLLLIGKPKRVENLGAEDCARYLRALEQSQWTLLVLLFFAIRTLLVVTFYEDASAYQDPIFLGIDRSIETKRADIPEPIESGVRLRDSDADASDEIPEAIAVARPA